MLHQAMTNPRLLAARRMMALRAMDGGAAARVLAGQADAAPGVRDTVELLRLADQQLHAAALRAADAAEGLEGRRVLNGFAESVLLGVHWAAEGEAV
ncbi:hypothetical protein [Sandaracinobacteroides saxicola]|uniref:Uncharacterized protein n=1 Tax=Sandaracinobacteroides saxicola TaxID=2759707 RepID=A0A7G5IIF9_9SPHN|nr:hypothetical protein [Sandaracinobacteroides saxicola]QMW23151.1 hypothetical protein H3309_01165 [Sandaracinobacteroides saxicola]